MPRETVRDSKEGHQRVCYLRHRNAHVKIRPKVRERGQNTIAPFRRARNVYTVV